MSAVRLADHEAILRQTLSLCEAQLYHQFHAALANTRRERARNAAAQLEAAKQQAQAELRAVPLDQLPSADAVQSLQSEAARLLRAEEEEHARLQRDMYTRMAAHVTAKAAQEDQYDQLCIQRAQQQLRESQDRLKQMVGSNIAAKDAQTEEEPPSAAASASSSAELPNNVTQQRQSGSALNSASSPSLRSRRSELRSDARQMRAVAPVAGAMSPSAGAATAAGPSLPAAAAPAHASSTAAATPHSARPESAPVHPQSQRTTGRERSPSAAAPGQEASRSRPRTAKRNVEFASTAAATPGGRSGSSSPARARSRPGSSSPPPPLFAPHAPLALGDSLLDASSVQSLIASLNSALALADRRYRVLPDRFRPGSPFGLPGERKQGHTRYARGILYSEGLGLSNVSKAVRQKLARKEAQVLAELMRKNELERVLAEKKAQEALHASASMLTPNDQHSAAAATVEIKGLDSSTLMAVTAASPNASAADRRRIEMEAEAKRLAAADARAESRRKTRRATAAPLPIVLSDGQTVDAATHAPVMPLLDYASFAQSPQEKLDARLKEEERLEQEKQKRIDRRWTSKQRRATAGAGGIASMAAAWSDDDCHRPAESDGNAPTPAAPSASSHGVDSVALYLNKSSASLDEVQRMRSEALSPLLGSTSRKTLNPAMHLIQQREQQKRRRATLGSAHHSHEANGTAAASVTDRAQSPPPLRSSSRLDTSSRSNSTERRASSRLASVEPAGSVRSAVDISSVEAATADSTGELRPESLMRVSSFKALSPTNSQRSSAVPSRSTSSLAHRPRSPSGSLKQTHVRKPSAEELRLPLPSSMLATIQGSPNKVPADADHTVRSSVFGHDTAASSKDVTPRELQQPPLSTQGQLASSRSQPALSHRSQQESPAMSSPVAAASPARSSSRSSSAMGSGLRHHAQLSLQVEEPEWMAAESAEETEHSVRTATTAGALVAAASLPTMDESPQELESQGRSPVMGSSRPAASPDAADYDLMPVWPHDRDARARVEPAKSNGSGDDESSGVSEDSAAEEEEKAEEDQRVPSGDDAEEETQFSLPVTPAQADTAAFSSMFEQLDNRSLSQHPRQLRPSSRDSRARPDTSQSLRSGPLLVSDPPLLDPDGLSSIDITLASLRSSFAKSRQRCEAVRADLLRAQRERDVQREQLAHAALLRADHSEWQRAEVMALTDCDPSAIAAAATSSSTGEPLRRAPRDGESYSAADHQLNLLYFHNLLYAALKEEKDLRFLRDHLSAEEQRMESSLKQDAARLAQLTQRTLDTKQAHLWTLQAEQKKVVGLLGEYERQSQSAAKILRMARELTRLWGQVCGFEREAPKAISVAAATKSNNGGRSDVLDQLTKNARTNNPLLPSCMRCHKALLPSAQDEALRVKLVAQKREGIKTHAALFALHQAQGDAGTAATATPSLTAAPRSRPHSAMPLHPTSSLLPRAAGAGGASTASLRSSASSLSSAGAAALGVAKGARTEWAMLEQLAALSKTMNAAQKSGADRSSSTAVARAAVSKAEFGIPPTKQARLRMAHDHSSPQFRGASILRPQSAAVHTQASTMINGGSSGPAEIPQPLRALNPGLSADGLAAARQIQQQLLAREHLHSYCDHFIHILSGRSVCRACRYALEAMPAPPTHAFGDEEKQSTSPSHSRSVSPPRASASAATLNSLFVPNQTALRFFERRRLVNLEDIDGNLQRRASSGKESRPVSAAHSAASRPQSAAAHQQQKPSSASGDTLSLLLELRALLGFHPQRSQQSSGSQYQKTRAASATSEQPQLPVHVHDAPNPVLRSGTVARVNLMQQPQR